MVYGFENLCIQIKSLLALESITQLLKSISHALDSYSYRTVAEVGIFGLFEWIESTINHSIEVSRNSLGHSMQRFKIKGFAIIISKLR